MKRFIHDKSAVDMVRDFESKAKEIQNSQNIECFDDEGILDEEDQFEFLRRKSVMDYDGFYTDYTLYYDVLNDRYVTVFGDRDLYRPEDGDFDAEFETEGEAYEWFDSYNGFEDDEDFN